MRPLKKSHGVTLRKSGGTYIIQYGRNNVSTENVVQALYTFDQYVLLALAGGAVLDIYYPESDEHAIKKNRK